MEKITIITICKNSEKTIEKTINSIINQNYNNLEYIIIDGNSEDKTNNIIEKYKKCFPIIHISENDKGIYNAMNKGVNISSGDWINFMNSGDTFYDKNTLKLIEKYLDNSYDIIYGNTEIIYKDFKIIKKEPQPNKLWMGRTPHQSSFIKSSTMKKHLYNENNKIVADFEFFMKVYYSKGKIKKIDQIISSFTKDGISEKMDKQVILDAYKTIKNFKKGLIVDIYYNIIKIKPFLKKLFPRKIFKFIKSSF